MSVTAIIAGSLIFTVVVIVFARRLLGRMMNGSKESQEIAAQLVKTGQKGRAQIVGVAPTGMVVNEIYIRTVLTFQIEPLDGSARFDGEKKMLIDQTNQPRIGDTWPCWYDQQDRTVFAVGQPTGDARDQIEVYREFGIAHPLDQ